MPRLQRRSNPAYFERVKEEIKQAIKNHPDYSADRIVGVVFGATPISVRATAREIGHTWPKARTSYRPKRNVHPISGP
jgi:hypothetical protein